MADDHGHALGHRTLGVAVGWPSFGDQLFVLGDQVVMAPLFMGSEPPRAQSGPYAGTEILVEEQSVGLKLIGALDPHQLAQAVVSPIKTANNNRGELFSDNVIIRYQGLPLSELGLSAIGLDQRQIALQLIRWHIGKLREPHAVIKMTEIVKYWDQTYFSWVGETSEHAVFYYRIHSPVVLIEYDHQTPIALDGLPQPSRDHVHTTLRTPNGNDYGRDLLRRHLQTHPHE